MDNDQISAFAKDLRTSMATKEPIRPLTEIKPDITMEEAYRVQMINVDLMEKEGKKIVGKKIGLTSKAMQDFLGVNEPDYGHLFDNMVWEEDLPIKISSMLQPKIEAEIAFVLGEDLKGPGITIADVLRATAGIMLSFEIVDSRVKDWKIKIQDTIADNASSAGFILGSKLIPVDQINLKYIGLVMEKNGVIMETATGAAVMGHPALAVAWLVNKMGSMGIGMKKGEIILSGSFTKALEIKAGDVFLATFGDLGSVKAVFTD